MKHGAQDNNLYIFLEYVRGKNSKTVEINKDGRKYPLLQRLDHNSRTKEIADIIDQPNSFSNFSLRLGVYTKKCMAINSNEKYYLEPLYILLTPGGDRPLRGFFMRDGINQIDKTNVYYLALDSDPNIFEAIFAHENAHLIDEYVMRNVTKKRYNRYIHAVSAITDDYTAFTEGWGTLFEIRTVERSQNVKFHKKYRLEENGTDDSYMLHLADAMSNNHLVKRYSWIRHNLFAFKKNNILSEQHPDIFVYNATNVNVNVGELKNAQQMMASEGVIAYFFNVLTSDKELQHTYMSDSFYSMFSIAMEDVSPEENLYLKIIYAKSQMSGKTPTFLTDFVTAYATLFPDEKKMIYTHFYISTFFTTVWSDAILFYRKVYLTSHLALSETNRANAGMELAEKRKNDFLASITPESNLEIEYIGNSIWLTNKKFNLPYFWSRHFWNKKTSLQINLNTADAYEFLTIPTISKKQALQIVEYREQIVYFSGINDLEQASILTPQQISLLKGMCENE